MLPGHQAGPGKDEIPEIVEPVHSFHDRLLSRSRTCLAGRKRGRPGRIANRSTWLPATARLIGEGAIFAGGLAIGNGIVNLRLGRPWTGRPGMVIAIGLGCILFAILARLAPKFGASRWTQAVRG